MRSLTAEEIMRALKKPEKRSEEEKPDFTYATQEPKVEPGVMPTGQGEL